MTKNTNELQSLRIEIDSVDGAILSVLAKRTELARAIGKYKQKHNLKLLDRKRWIETVKTRVTTGRSMGLSPRFIREIFELIHKNSLFIQKRAQNHESI